MYYAQNKIEGCFQEYVPFMEYAFGPNRGGDPVAVDLSVIQDIPITLIASTTDEQVSVEHSESILNDIGYTQKNMWFVDGWIHRDFAGGKDDAAFASQIDQTITYGTVVDFDDYYYGLGGDTEYGDEYD